MILDFCIITAHPLRPALNVLWDTYTINVALYIQKCVQNYMYIDIFIHVHKLAVSFSDNQTERIKIRKRRLEIKRTIESRARR